VAGPSRDQLFEILRGFELAHEGYAEFQRTMERYWCLRWLLQEDVDLVEAEVIREDLARIGRIPLVCRSSSLAGIPVGTRVVLRLSDIDLIELTVHAEFQKILETTDIT
jgi:exoribonuclease-2